MLVGNQVKKQAEGLSAREHFGHSLKIVVFTHLSLPRNQELCLGLRHVESNKQMYFLELGC